LYSPSLILLVGLLYIVLFGGLSLLRREGLSTRFAVEALVVTFILGAIDYLIPFSIDVFFFLIILYLVTMRVRLLVDLGIFFAKRRNFKLAEQLYNFALKIWPDGTGKMIIAVNRGVTAIASNDMDNAITILKNVLATKENGHLGIKHEVAAHYNLGVVYMQKEMPALAIHEFRTVLEIWPTSEYARRAEAAIQKNRDQPQ
jgi:tetratricopeptide (TPR) repeat protein